MSEPFVYDIIVSPGQVDEAIASKWLNRLTSSVDEIRSEISKVDFRQVFAKAAEGFNRFMGSDDPRRALAALKHQAALAVADPDAAKQKLIQKLTPDENGEIPYVKAVQEKADKYKVRTAFILPAAEAARSFTSAFYDWALDVFGNVAMYLRAAVAAPTVYVSYLAAVFVAAAKNGNIGKDEAEQILAQAANDLKQVLDLIVDGKGVTATVNVNVDDTNWQARIHVEIPAPSQQGG